MELSEEELLASIHQVLSDQGPGVRIGVGDDAAVLAPLAGELVVTTDALVEGVHFDPAVTSAMDLGYKAIVVSVSDVAAMAASPKAAVCAITLSDVIEAAWVMELFDGLREACREYALGLVGGDLSRGPAVSIAVTVVGEVAPGKAVQRSGALAGDRIAVTGVLGAAAAALRLRKDGSLFDDGDRELLRALQRPVARVGEAQVLARRAATAMIDISDGLALDLSRLCSASGVGARLRVDDVPVAEGATLEDALTGGEDYELIVTLPQGELESAARELHAAFGVALTGVGDVISEDRLVVVGEEGNEAPLQPKGWDHFGQR